MRHAAALALLPLVLLGACDGDTDPAAETPTPGSTVTSGPVPTTSVGGSSEPDRFPDVVDVEAIHDGGADTWTFAVTLTSPYDTPDRYADGWRIVGPDGTVYGVHTLTHDHAAEQPFTRRQAGVEIPDDVDRVTVEGRDQANGFGGQTVTVTLLR